MLLLSSGHRALPCLRFVSRNRVEAARCTLGLRPGERAGGGHGVPAPGGLSSNPTPRPSPPRMGGRAVRTAPRPQREEGPGGRGRRKNRLAWIAPSSFQLTSGGSWCLGGSVHLRAVQSLGAGCVGRERAGSWACGPALPPPGPWPWARHFDLTLHLETSVLLS